MKMAEKWSSVARSKKEQRGACFSENNHHKYQFTGPEQRNIYPIWSYLMSKCDLAAFMTTDTTPVWWKILR